jgi:hypothetical protein
MYIFIGYGPLPLDRDPPAGGDWPENTLFLDELGAFALDDDGVLVLE